MMNWIKNRLKELGSLPVDLTAFMTSVLFLLLGFFALFFMKVVLNMGQDSAIQVSILLIPILLYLILSGRLQELSAGGLNAKFSDVARKSLDDSNAALIDPGEAIPLTKTVTPIPRVIERELQNIDERKYIVLTVTLGKTDYYGTEALLDYLKGLSAYPNFKFLVILEPTGEVFAYISGWRAIQILERDNDYQENIFVDALNGNQTGKLLSHGLIKPTLTTTDTKIDALKELTFRL